MGQVLVLELILEKRKKIFLFSFLRYIQYSHISFWKVPSCHQSFHFTGQTVQTRIYKGGVRHFQNFGQCFKTINTLFNSQQEHSRLQTGLPTKNATSDTTVRTLYCFFSHIYEYIYNHFSFVAKSFNKPFKGQFQVFFIISSFVGNPDICKSKTGIKSNCLKLKFSNSNTFAT